MSSCSSVKYVPDNEYLLDKVHIQSNNSEYGVLELRPYIRQLPNYKMFGLNKTQLQVYNLSGKNNNRWINRFLKRIGEPPVIFDSLSVEKTTLELKKFFLNKGYMDVESSAIIEKNKKKAEVTYIIQPNRPYRIQNFEMEIEDAEIKAVLDSTNRTSDPLLNENSSLRRPLIKQGLLFDRDLLDKERERLTTLLRNRGYYAFEKEFISYEADSSVTAHEVNLKLLLHLNPEILPSGTYIETPHRKYYFNKVYIYLDCEPLGMTNPEQYQASDSIVFRNYTIYFRGKSPSLSQSVLLGNNFLVPGRAYSQLREEMTYTAYGALQSIDNINILYDEFMQNDTAFLDCHLLTMSTKKQSVSFSIEGTNTAGDFGIATSSNYTHRNLFKKSETFNLKLRGAYEAIDRFDNPYFEVGTETSVSLPRFLFPFASNDFKRRTRASTEFSISYNYQTRPEYDRTLFSSGLRYNWNKNGTAISNHRFDLLDINYVHIPYIDSTFESILPPSARLFGYRDQFIVGMGYSFSHSTYDPSHKRQNIHTLRTNIESAGNLLYGLSKLFDFEKDSRGVYRLFGTYYSQFIKGDIDYSKTIYLDKNNSIAWRIGGGVGVPYGNTKELPFERRYYSGGANSVRAWSVRTLGPGSYHPSDSTITSFYNYSGDIKLDLNMEYRTRFFWKLETAVFIDAGNIWTIREYEGQEGGMFRLNSFYKQIAIGYGLGFRLDYDFFLVRLDMGWKAYNPALSGTDRWTFFHPNFTNNFAWHIAVGYPF
jgi:hypothetical protein